MRGHERRDVVAALRSYPAFAGCDDGDLNAIAAAANRFSLPAGWTLVQEGIPSDACYVIMEGSAGVYRDREQIATVGEGAVVGEMTLLAGGQRRATVTSVTPISGVRVENEVFGKMLEDRPHLRDALTAVYRSHEG